MIDALTEKAEEIYYSALEVKSAEQRQAFVDRACLGDAQLRALVGKLLASQPEAEKLFPEGGVAGFTVSEISQTLEDIPGLLGSATAASIEEETIGRRIGSYKLLQKIGEGGCGVVYMAEQEQPVRRRVAFKIIKLGMDTKSVVARFEAERQALALMDHPNIARVLDAGATQSGRPFFVMELVRGIKITEYCDQSGLDTSGRLKLFVQVCQAIQHAHQKGVIHRDIKPSNILVTMIDGVPVPKVIDFGIAKAIEGRLTDNTIFTAYEQFIGTPAYMSPEQAVMSGVDVDTRSDIYSLGVLLYELLTGRTPFETSELLQSGIDGLRRTLQDKEPQRPSVMVTTIQGSALAEMARNRQAEPLKLVSLLRGDLDWIVMRALEKDRARRYETANGLAMDIQRYLDNEPVLARPPSRLYRLQKLVRRNKVLFASVTVVVLALVCGLGTSVWFWRREREARLRSDAAENKAVTSEHQAVVAEQQAVTSEHQAVMAEQQALAAEQQEARLRREAEDRERITEAAFLISQSNMEDADQLVEKVSELKPSLEAESVLRTLGKWHALKEQWAKAAERFNLLLVADQKDNSWAITEDLLMAGPIQIEHGNPQDYERFRLAALARYTGTTDPVFAERTLKISLLLPADEQLMKSLEPLSEIASRSLNNASQDPLMESWRCVSLALMAYRQNHAPTANAWSQRCLSYPGNNPARIATAHIIRAMAYHQLGDASMSQSELAKGHEMVKSEFAGAFQEGDGAAGYWYDWLFARILLREAETLTATSPAAGK